MEEIRTTCAIAGGGPAGMMLGFLLARAGADVVALEKQAKLRLSIPLCGGMDSINVAAASAICLYAGFSRPQNPRRC